ncbi:MAG: TonB-dependent receptor [Bacteroidales bacterium]
MKKLLNVILITAMTCSAFSQPSDQIAGKVVHNEEGVPFLSVYMQGTSNGTITNENGAFTLQGLPGEEVLLCIDGLGYKTIYHPLTPGSNQEELLFQIEEDELLLEEVVVTGSRVGLLRYLPGSANIVQQRELAIAAPVSANEILRNIPGVHVVDEEGAGLRVNIGIRGLDPDRSRNVLVLEDGIPVALAPYGEPEMYYSPNIERMAGMEVLKGNGSILFGPQTIGGVVNYITDDPGKEPAGKVAFRAGDFGYNSTYLKYGNTINNLGFAINYNRKAAREFGPTTFLLHDLNTKLVMDLSPKSKLSMKLGVYDENSNSTYVGITQAMYDAGGYDYLTIAPDDNLHIRRYAVSASHAYQVKDGLKLNTTLFAYTTSRDWNRQDFTYDPGASRLTDIVHGTEYANEGAIFMRDGTGQRNRQFEVAGIEPRLSYRYELLNMTSKLDAGVRFLYERAYEQRVNGTRAGVASGDLRNDETRTGNAFSSFIQHKTLLTEQLTITAGLRSEIIRYERDIFRLNHVDTLIGNSTRDFALIPGAGINYNISDNIGLFTGLHRGYAPPRTKDAISNNGIDLELEAENSWNYELGMRTELFGAKMELTAFYMNFSNQVIPVSESSGGAGAGLINGGATTHKGVEMSVLMPLNGPAPGKWNNSFMVAGTYVDSRFSSDRYILEKTGTNEEISPVYVSVKGNKTPYAPELTLSSALVIDYAGTVGLRLSGNYTGAQFTDALNTEDVRDYIAQDAADSDYNYKQATLNGRIGIIRAHFVADASAWYRLGSSGLEFTLAVKNLTDERYIASRRPQGLRVGMPRFISGGISYNF